MTAARRFNWYPLVVTVLLLLAGWVVFGRAMLRQVNHDEHYFIAPGVLLARQGLLPYLDYPYTHMPGLVLVYALVAGVTDYLLFGVRLVSVLCAVILLCLILGWGLRVFRDEPAWQRLLLASGLVWLLVACPLFAYTSGLAWNHDWPVLMLALAYLVHVVKAGHPRAGWWNLLAGLLAALAVEARISFGLALIPFGLSLLLFYPHPDGWKGRLRLLAAFGAGFLVGMLPAIVLFVQAPARFWFGNFGFFEVYSGYHQASGTQERMDLPAKLAFLFNDVLAVPGNFLLLVSWLVFGVLAELIAAWQARRVHFDSLLALLLVLFLTASGLAPSPVFAQYFYDQAPFAVFGIALGLSRVLGWLPRTQPGPAGLERAPAHRWAAGGFVLLVLLANLYMVHDYGELRRATSLPNWAPLQVHTVGYVIRQQVGGGAVFTLSPLYPLEGGLPIYPSMATGPFIWRVAGQIPPQQRQQNLVLAAQDLPGVLAAQPPAAILVGEEGDLEISLVDYARQNGYTLTPVAEKLQLWLKNPTKK